MWEKKKISKTNDADVSIDILEEFPINDFTDPIDIIVQITFRNLVERV